MDQVGKDAVEEIRGIIEAREEEDAIAAARRTYETEYGTALSGPMLARIVNAALVAVVAGTNVTLGPETILAMTREIEAARDAAEDHAFERF